jgi:hypothetical protein
MDADCKDVPANPNLIQDKTNSSTLRKEVTHSSETSSDFDQATQRYIAEDKTLQK